VVVVHPPHEGAVNAEHPFDLGRMGKLEFRVDVPAVLDRPVVCDLSVNAATIGPELRPRFHFFEKKLGGIGLRGLRPVEHVPGELPRPFLFGHEQRHIFEESLVHLHDALEDMGFLRQVCPELPEPVPCGAFGEMHERGGLPDRDRAGPAPEEHPELLVRQLHVAEPGVREQRELSAAPEAAVTSLISHDLSRTAHGTKDALPEHDATDIFPYLSFRRNLVEMVHAFHDSEAVPTRSYYPFRALRTSWYKRD